MKDFTNWCKYQEIQYESEFHYKKEYPLLANIWNLFTYTRFRLEELWQMKVSQRWKQESC